MLKIDFEYQILALFDVYFWPFNKSREKFNTFFFLTEGTTMSTIYDGDSSNEATITGTAIVEESKIV